MQTNDTDATRRLAQLRQDIQAVDEITKSRGWAVLMEAANDEIRAAFRHFVANPTAPDKHLDFQRGAIWAAFAMEEMPGRLMNRMQAEYEILNATARPPSKDKE